jgi:DNA-binding NarL/FixJ family response regulator
VLEDMPGIEIVGEIATGEEFLARCFEPDFDVILLDLQMPGMGGLEALHEARQITPGLRCIVLTMYDEDAYAVRALREGALGYLTKSASGEELVTAIESVAAGGRYITPSAAQALAHFVLDADQPSHIALTQREFEVFLRIAQGQTSAGIGKELAISVKSVGATRARVLEKMGMQTNAEIVRYALEHRLLPATSVAQSP